MSGYNHITFDSLLLEEKSNFNCCYIYITDYGYPSYTIRYKDEGNNSEDKFKALIGDISNEVLITVTSNCLINNLLVPTYTFIY